MWVKYPRWTRHPVISGETGRTLIADLGNATQNYGILIITLFTHFLFSAMGVSYRDQYRLVSRLDGEQTSGNVHEEEREEEEADEEEEVV